MPTHLLILGRDVGSAILNSDADDSEDDLGGDEGGGGGGRGGEDETRRELQSVRRIEDVDISYR